MQETQQLRPRSTRPQVIESPIRSEPDGDAKRHDRAAAYLNDSSAGEHNDGSWLYWLGCRSAAHPWRVLTIWVALAVSLVVGSATLGDAFNDSMSVPGVDSDRALQLLTAAGSDAAGVTAQVVVAPADRSATLDGPTAAARLGSVESTLAALANVEAIATTVAPDASAAIVVVHYRTLDQLSSDDLDRLNGALGELRAESAGSSTPLQIEAGGELYWNYSEASSSRGELIGIGLAMLILLVAFGSVLAMGLPIVTAVFGLVVGISLVTVASHFVTTPSTAPQMGLMIGLGVGIDYALFLVTRFREYPHTTRAEVNHAAGSTVATAGKAVLFAGGTVVIAILGLAVTGIAFITALGVATSLIVAVTVAASLTLLPALLGVVGRHIDRWSLHGRAVSGTEPVGSRRWHRWGEHVSRHAWAYAIATTVALLAMTAPVLDLQLGFPDDGVLAESRTERRAYDIVADAFGPGANGPLLIAVDTSPVQPGPARLAAVTAIEAAITDDPGIAAVLPPDVNDAAGVATMIALPTTAPRDHATNLTVERLRQVVLRDAVDPAASAGTDEPVAVFIGGTTATFDDLADRVAQRLPWFIATVVGLSFILLMIAFRSIVVPLKAAVMNLLSIGAAYGLMVMVFQWGWGKSLIGLETTIPIMSFVPMFMFAILFGLSMDYEVFLLTRVREFYDATGNNERSVIDGIAVTARVITSAALIMISVFGGFVFGNDPTVKMLGLGMATAIFVDATVVRLVLVPATMKLMGDANWWLPGWLKRHLPTLHLD